MKLTKATLLSGSIYLIFSMSIFIMTTIDNWEVGIARNSGDSVANNEINIDIASGASMLAFVYSITMFPLIARCLKSKFTSRRWILANVIIIFIFAFLSTYLLRYYSYSEGGAVSTLSNPGILSLVFFTISVILLTPGMFIWLSVIKTRYKRKHLRSKK